MENAKISHMHTRICVFVPLKKATRYTVVPRSFYKFFEAKRLLRSIILNSVNKGVRKMLRKFSPDDGNRYTRPLFDEPGDILRVNFTRHVHVLRRLQRVSPVFPLRQGRWEVHNLGNRLQAELQQNTRDTQQATRDRQQATRDRQHKHPKY